MLDDYMCCGKKRQRKSIGSALDQRRGSILNRLLRGDLTENVTFGLTGHVTKPIYGNRRQKNIEQELIF